MQRLAAKQTARTPTTSLWQHFLSLGSLLWLCLNLIIALSLLLPIALIKLLLPIAPLKRICDGFIQALYRWAVRVDTFYLTYIVGIELDIRGELGDHPAPLIISNHHCGFDVALLQEIVSGKGPMLKFLIKKELVWLPIVGWVCLLLDFPRLNRNQGKGDQAKDYKTVKDAIEGHGIERNSHSGALLIFPEGTRFDQTKRRQQGSPYRHLLKPKSGGLRIIQQHAEAGTPLIDITIDYGQREPVSLWRCLHGRPEKITIHIDHYQLDDIENIQAWLNRRWQEKDELLRRPARCK
ncbi:MAG: 1-acyl-sn-glycerol-3-phosphate acyltransferase [Cellvibrionaceae bacterium]|nr:1-acyl-sn-glycerol-3-phosphate acyltransferase [Cellvibrionaceae bacterium]MCV6626016.1 1-acyl-sn-glycerol-3-phosphate acyltransferase [Cellvibrionaceae bacterium]